MKRLFLLMVFLAVSIQSDAAKMSSYTNNTTPNGDVYFVGVDPNDISQTANGSNYRYSLNSILNLGLLDAVFNSLSISGTGDSWIELENNTSFSDSIAGKYGLRFYNGALQQIINGMATDIGSASVIQRSSDPVYTDLSTGQIAVSTSSGDLFIKTSTGMYTFAGSYVADPTPPTFASASIAVDGVTVTTGFSEAVSQGAGYSDLHFNLDASVTGNDIGLTYVSGSGTNSWVFTAASTILQGETVNLDFSGAENSVEDGDGTDMEAVINYTVTNGSTQNGDLLSETWEGVAGWSVYNEESACTINQENTSTPIVGLKSLTISSPGYQEGYVYNTLSSSAENVSISFNYVPIALPSNTANLLYIFNNSTIIARIQQRVDGTFAVVDGVESAYSSTPLVSGTTYKIWVDRVKGTGANGQLKVYVAAGTSPSKPQSADGAVTTGTSTLAVSGIGFGTMNAGSIKIDSVLVE